MRNSLQITQFSLYFGYPGFELRRLVGRRELCSQLCVCIAKTAIGTTFYGRTSIGPIPPSLVRRTSQVSLNCRRWAMCRNPAKLSFSTCQIGAQILVGLNLVGALTRGIPTVKRGMAKGVSFLTPKSLMDALDKINPDLEFEEKKGNPLSVCQSYALSFSIPVVTICALILLMIIINILHFFLQWLPYAFVRLSMKCK